MNFSYRKVKIKYDKLRLSKNNLSIGGFIPWTFQIELSIEVSSSESSICEDSTCEDSACEMSLCEVSLCEDSWCSASSIYEVSVNAVSITLPASSVYKEEVRDISGWVSINSVS